MKILKLNASGYKRLKENFEINFLAKSRVTENDLENEVLEIEKKLYFPTTTVFTGKNSSGKSTVLELINMCYNLLHTGRIKYNELMFKKDLINLELWFIQNSIVYYYTAEIAKPNIILYSSNENDIYCEFKNENLYEHRYSIKYGKRILNQEFIKNLNYLNNISDTSILYNLTKDKYYSFNLINKASKTTCFEMYNEISKILPSNIKKNLLLLLDESIEELEKTEEEDIFIIKRFGEEKRKLNFNSIISILSDGTVRGLFLFTLAILFIRTGGTLIIDEIENSFHKNLVENLIILFNDKRINKNKANLIFSTHYVEILDIFKRSDNIFVLEKKHGYIECNNLYSDYDKDTRLLKSNLYNKNAFNTNLNYDILMNLKREIINEVSNNDRG